MNCKHAELLISKRIDGEISQRELAELELHLQQCHSCMQSAFSMSVIISHLDTIEPETAPNDGWDKLQIALNNQKARPAIFRVRALAFSFTGLVLLIAITTALIIMNDKAPVAISSDDKIPPAPIAGANPEFKPFNKPIVDAVPEPHKSNIKKPEPTQKILKASIIAKASSKNSVASVKRTEQTANANNVKRQVSIAKIDTQVASNINSEMDDLVSQGFELFTSVQNVENTGNGAQL